MKMCQKLASLDLNTTLKHFSLNSIDYLIDKIACYQYFDLYHSYENGIMKYSK